MHLAIHTTVCLANANQLCLYNSYVLLYLDMCLAIYTSLLQTVMTKTCQLYTWIIKNHNNGVENTICTCVLCKYMRTSHQLPLKSQQTWIWLNCSTCNNYLCTFKDHVFDVILNYSKCHHKIYQDCYNRQEILSVNHKTHHQAVGSSCYTKAFNSIETCSIIIGIKA